MKNSLYILYCVTTFVPEFGILYYFGYNVNIVCKWTMSDGCVEYLRLCCILVYFLLNVWPVFAWAVCLHKCVYVFFSGINMDCTYSSILFVLLICLLLIVHLNITGNPSDSGVPHLVAPLYFTSKSLRKETVAVFAGVVV